MNIESLEEENKQREERLYNDLINVIGGLNDYFDDRDLNNKGRDVTPTGKQLKITKSIASNLRISSTKSNHRNSRTVGDVNAINGIEIDESMSLSTIRDFDLLSKPRILVNSSYINRKESDRLSKKFIFLFNDVILITNKKESSEIYDLNIVLYIKDLKIKHSNFIPLFSDNSNDDHLLIELISSKTRTRQQMSLLLQFENEIMKTNWLEDLENVMLAYHKDSQFGRQLGWYHEIILGNMNSAAYNGDAVLLRKHIKHNESNNIPIDLQDKSGMTPLNWAVLNGHQVCVKLLLDHGADPELKQKGSNTSLLLAACRGHDNIVRILLEYGVSITERNIQDKDILHLSIVYGNSSKGLLNLLQILVNRGIDINQLDRQGCSPLHLCAEKNISRPIRMLVDLGADINLIHGKTFLTALQIACSNQTPDIETIRSLLDKGAYCNWKDSLGRTALSILFQNQPMASLTPTSSTKRNSFKSTSDTTITSDNDIITSNQEDSNNSKWRNMEITLELVGRYAVTILPIILEIIRKGGRYDAKDIENIRPSFRLSIVEARGHWDSKTIPENFNEFVNLRSLSGDEIKISTSNWNKVSTVCELCTSAFTIKLRKHHCRACGVTCCDSCSTKRLPLTGITTSKPVVKTSKSFSFSSNSNKSFDDKIERVCDSCFNSLCFEASQPSPENFRTRYLKQCSLDLLDSVGSFLDLLDDSNNNDNRETISWKEKSPTNITWSTYNDSPSSSCRESMNSSPVHNRGTNERLSIGKNTLKSKNSNESIIEIMKLREDKLSKCEDIIYKFLEASQGYRKQSKSLIESKMKL